MADTIFINYRREETGVVAQYLAKRLEEAFGKVFLDMHSIPAGENWLQRLHRAVDASAAMLVLIGKDWLEAKDEHGRRRLDDPNDPLTHEISRALAMGIPVLPILVDDAKMPAAHSLPRSIAALADLHALPFRSADIELYTGPIIDALRDRIAERRANRRRRRLPIWSLALVALAALVVGVVAGVSLGPTAEHRADARAADLVRQVAELEMRSSQAVNAAVEANARTKVAEEKATKAVARAKAAEGAAATAEARAKASEAEAAKANERAKAAEERATKANERASGAETEATKANGRASAAEAEVTKANERARAAEEKATKADARARATEGAATRADARAKAAEEAAAKVSTRLEKALTKEALDYLKSIKVASLEKGEQLLARRLFELAGILGDPVSKAQLARMLFYGEGGTMDKVRALTLWEAAADDGNAIAACNAGIWYGGIHKEAAIARNPKKGAHYLLKGSCRDFLGTDCDKHLLEDTRKALQEEQSRSGRYGGKIDGSCSFGRLSDR